MFVTKGNIAVHAIVPALASEIMDFDHIVEMGWVLLKLCNNREEATTECFPRKCIKPEENSTETLCCPLSMGEKEGGG